MTEYCDNPPISATCALVVVFPSTTGSGNPGNCGNACSCAKSKCPATPPLCDLDTCGGTGGDTTCPPGMLAGCACEGGINFSGPSEPT